MAGISFQVSEEYPCWQKCKNVAFFEMQQRKKEIKIKTDRANR